MRNYYGYSSYFGLNVEPSIRNSITGYLIFYIIEDLIHDILPAKASITNYFCIAVETVLPVQSKVFWSSFLEEYGFFPLVKLSDRFKEERFLGSFPVLFLSQTYSNFSFLYSIS